MRRVADHVLVCCCGSGAVMGGCTDWGGLYGGDNSIAGAETTDGVTGGT